MNSPTTSSLALTDKLDGVGEDVAGLVAAVGEEIEPASLDLAMTHRSYAYENGGLPTNERLEFLGDSVLGVVITEELFRRHPDLPEGQLAVQVRGDDEPNGLVDFTSCSPDGA